MVRETSVEKALVRESRRLGGDCMKIMPVVAGYPDRLVLLPVVGLRLVETKAPDGEVRPAQRVFIDRAAAIGIEVEVIWDTAQVRGWAARMRALIEAPDALAVLADAVEAQATLMGAPWALDALARAGLR